MYNTQYKKSWLNLMEVFIGRTWAKLRSNLVHGNILHCIFLIICNACTCMLSWFWPSLLCYHSKSQCSSGMVTTLKCLGEKTRQTKATFTRQVLMRSSNFLLRSDFFCVVIHITIQMQPPSDSSGNRVRPWSDPQAQKRMLCHTQNAAFTEVNMDATHVRVCVSILKLLCDWSWQNIRILIESKTSLSFHWLAPSWMSTMLVSSIVYFRFCRAPPPPAQNCDVCLTSVMLKLDEMTVQTEVALKNIRYVSDLGPHMKVSWIWFEKIRFVLFRLS